MYVCMYVCVYVCMRVHVYVCMCVCVYVCVCVQEVANEQQELSTVDKSIHMAFVHIH